MKVVVIVHDYHPSHLYAGDEGGGNLALCNVHHHPSHLYHYQQGGGNLARQKEDVQHLPTRSLLLLCLHWIQHIVTNTGDYDFVSHWNQHTVKKLGDYDHKFTIHNDV